MSEELKAYIAREFESIKGNPTYINHQRAGNLIVFEDDKLFHIQRPLPGWFEWRILCFNSIRSTVDDGYEPTNKLQQFIDNEFQAIQNDPTYRAYMNQARLKVINNDKLFQMELPLPGFCEWRILSYNALRSHWLRYKQKIQVPTRPDSSSSGCHRS